MAHLLIIDLPGGNDTDILKAALDARHTFTFLSSDLSLYRGQPAVSAYLDEAFSLIEVPDFEYDTIEKKILEIHRRNPFEALLCLIEIRLTEAARLAQCLNLRHLSPLGAQLLRDKFNVRLRLSQAGLAQPDFALATSTQELKQAIRNLGLPVLIKPVDGYGSQNIVALRTKEDLDPLFSPVEMMLPSHADYGLGVVANDRLLVERYLTGDFIGCDTFTLDGKHHLLGVNEKLMFPPPSFAIRGGCFTPRIPNDARHKALEEYVFSALDAVGFDQGATHIELMVTQDGPQLIEINPRLVGAKIARQVGYAMNRSIHLDLINLHLGRLILDTFSPTKHHVAVTRWVTVQESGIIENIELPSWTHPSIACVDILKKVGQPVSSPFENADRIGYVVTSGQSRLEMEALAERYTSETVVHLR
jgi:biotin carboxylase